MQESTGAPLTLNEKELTSVIEPNTIISFGKLKGQPYSALLLRENAEYSKWIIAQGVHFKYKDTRQWIIDQDLPKKNNLKRYISIEVINDENGKEHPYYPTFFNSLLTLTRKHKEFITLKL